MMDDDDDFGADPEFIQALAAASSSRAQPKPTQPTPPAQRLSAVQQPTPQRTGQIQQPTPQRLDKAPAAAGTSSAAGRIVQPTPQALPSRGSGSSILVSPRQKNNPVLEFVKSIPWEYSDIPADYGLGFTTCALFLSLKYHRLHPEYIYTRIRNLQGRFQLRVLLTMVDIPNHEDALRELSKTALVNNVTLILCWSAQEAARYLELYKSYEHASPAAIKGQQASSYAERLVEFVTTPRSINKADAVALVSTFGSLRNAVNADPEQVAAVGGWGERKVKSWCRAIEEPFRVRKAAGVGAGSGKRRPANATPARGGGDARQRQQQSQADKSQMWNPNLGDDEEDAALQAALEESRTTAGSSTTAAPSQTDRSSSATSRADEQLDEGVAAALARLREKG